MGIMTLFKTLAPLSFYLSGLGFAFLACLGQTRWALLFATFLLPLRNVIEQVQHFPLGNQFMDILLLGVIVGGLAGIKSSAKPSNKSPINTIAVILVVYLLFSLLRGGVYLYGGISFNIHDSRVQDWKNFALLPLLFYLNLKNNKSKKEVWTTFAAMCVTMFLVANYTAKQIGLHSSLVSREQIKGTFQFLGPNEVAAFFNVYTVILMGVFYGLKKSWKKWLLLALIFANLYCITFLYSRGAYAGLMLGLFILFAFKDKKLLVPLILVLCLWQVLLPQNVIDRIKETRTQTGQLDISSQRRILIWEQALNYAKINPLIGIGFGSFRRLGLDLADTHNIYIKTLTEQGVVGLILFAIILLTFIREGWRLYQKGDDELSKGLGLGFFCGIFVVMANNLFGDRWSYLEINAYLWIFAALVARLNHLAENPQPQAAETKTKTAPADGPVKKKKLRYYDPSPG